MKKPERLSATFVDKVSTPGRYGHGRGGHGLSLLVTVTTNGRKSKTFTQRIKIKGKETNLGLGSYPTVTLAMAQQRALENKQAVESGEDPRHLDHVPTLREAAEKVIAERRPMWRNPRSESQWRATLENYAFGEFGDTPIDLITAEDIENCLREPWSKTTDTTKKVLQRIGTIMDWAIRKGYREFNPVPAARSGLVLIKGKKKKRHRTVDHTELVPLLEVVHQSNAHPSTKLCIDFIALTAARSGEAREATWGEIDFDTRTWTVPEGRMKAESEHKVPLSEHAIEVLLRAEQLQRDDDSNEPLADYVLIFPSPRGKVLSNNTLSKLCRELELGFVPHGLRSTFRDWCAEDGVERNVAEQALAHKVPGVEGAYLRTTHLKQRRPLMDAWGEYLRPHTARNVQKN